MKILIVCNIPPWVKGGAETQAMKLGVEWCKLGHEVVIAGQLIPTVIMERDGVKIPLIHIPFIGWSRSLRAISYSLGLAWFIICHSRQFDIVYCRFVQEAAVVLSLVKRFFKMSFKLVACSACALDTGCANFLHSLPWSKAIISSLNVSVNAINNISAQTGHELAAIGLNSSKFTFIGNGTTIPKCIHQFIDGKNRRMICISRLASNKGHARLIDALSILKDKGNHIDMTFIGDGPEKQRLELLVEKKKLTGNIHFLGHIENDLIFDYLVQYDIFILPSDSEGFATVVIEAMAAGLPVIVTRSGGPEYFVDKQVGRTCERKNMQALLYSIKELLDMRTEELEAMGMRGRKLVLNRFEMSSVAQQYEVLFNRLMR